MYEFHYDIIMKKYFRFNQITNTYHSDVKLLFTDTDSLTYLIKTYHLTKDMKTFKSELDTSNYPPDHELYSKDNAKVLGKMKDECGVKVKS